jgi:hypothetical protein
MSEPEVNESLISLINTLNYIFERDYMGHAPPVIDHAHHQQHGGNYFTFGTRLPALDGSVSYLFKTLAVANKRPHFQHHINSSGLANLYLYESPTVVGDGTLLGNPPIWNHLQGGGTAVNLEVYINPNISNPGTLRPSNTIGGTGVGGRSVSGEGDSRDENIFANDKYWLAVIDTDDPFVVNYHASWYEKGD